MNHQSSKVNHVLRILSARVEDSICKSWGYVLSQSLVWAYFLLKSCSYVILTLVLRGDLSQLRQAEGASVTLLEVQWVVVLRLGIGLPIVHRRKPVHNQSLHNAHVFKAHRLKVKGLYATACYAIPESLDKEPSKRSLGRPWNDRYRITTVLKSVYRKIRRCPGTRLVND